MFVKLIQDIKTILDSLIGTDKPLAKVYDYPASKIEGYPAAIFFPVGVDSEFHSTAENFMTYRFKIFIINETKVAGKSTVFKTYLANAVDEVIEKFAESWDGGTTTEGQRIWYTLTSGDWTVNEGQDGEEVVAELNLLIKVALNN